MYPPRFRYHRPASLPAAVELLASLGEGAKLLAGGQSLIPLMKQRLYAPDDLVDIGRLAGLSYVESGPAGLRLGALTRHRDVERANLGAALQILRDAASVIADRQVRNRGTVGGSLAHADPGADLWPVFLALDADVDAIGPAGRRTVRVRELCVDAYATSLAADEAICEVRVPAAGRRAGAYLALKRRAGDFAVASAAVAVDLDPGGACIGAGVGLGNVALTPLYAEAAARALIGTDLGPDAGRRAADAAMEIAEPVPDLRGGADYKREVLGVLVRRAVEVARRRASGEGVNVADYV